MSRTFLCLTTRRTTPEQTRSVTGSPGPCNREGLFLVRLVTPLRRTSPVAPGPSSESSTSSRPGVVLHDPDVRPITPTPVADRGSTVPPLLSSRSGRGPTSPPGTTSSGLTTADTTPFD